MLFPTAFRDSGICILGLGYVGLTLATVMAEVGFTVTGVEVDADAVRKLREGEPHFYEHGLRERLARVVADARLRVYATIPDGSEATVYVITVGTPLGGDRRVRLDMIRRAAGEVASVLNDGDLVVVRSTVRIGTTRAVVLPVLEATGRSFDLAFCPERTLQGRALEELRALPQIVAGLTHDANVRAAQLFQFVTPTVVRVSSLEAAETIKVVDNAQRDVRFAFSNEVASVCDALGISASEVVAAGKLGYPRTDLPPPGPVGGPCLSKDPYILAESVEEHGVVPELTVQARRINERQPSSVVTYLRTVAGRDRGFPTAAEIALLGIAFKGRPATDDLRGTPARRVLDELRIAFPAAAFRGFDPEVSKDRIAEFGLEPHATLESVLSGAHLALILNNHDLFATMDVQSLAQLMARPGLLYDMWGHFIPADLLLPPGIGYAAFGSHCDAVLPPKVS